MMDFAELIAAKDKAIAYNDECEEALKAAQLAEELAQTKHGESSMALVAAHDAIHHLLTERGEHYLIDQKDGTLTVYKPSDEPPGYLAVHPIPGTKTAETKKAK